MGTQLKILDYRYYCACLPYRIIRAIRIQSKWQNEKKKTDKKPHPKQQQQEKNKKTMQTKDDRVEKTY